MHRAPQPPGHGDDVRDAGRPNGARLGPGPRLSLGDVAAQIQEEALAGMPEP
jgi:hypothetical protein